MVRSGLCPLAVLSLYRLHARDCKHRAKGRKWTRCQCAIWTQGSLSGRWVKMSLHTRNWTAAAKIIHNWEATGKIGEEPPDIPTIKRAVEKYLADAEARHLAPETVRKRRELLEGKLVPYLRDEGLRAVVASRRRCTSHVPCVVAVLAAVGAEATRISPQLLSLLP